ncbi:MAG: pitrilysin family protein [Candidatus Zixiibacteriota bacterium]
MKALFIIGALVALLALTAVAENPRDMKFPAIQFDSPEPERWVTDNGIVIFFLEDHQLPVVIVQAFIRGGDIYEPAELTGLSEITATLLRSGGAGSRTPDQVDADLDFVGASMSSSSSADALSMSLRSLKKDIDPIFQIFADMLINPRFDSAKVVMEISNKKDRILRQNDDPGSVARRIFYETIYKGHPYGKYATLESVDKISRNDITAFHKQYYSPDNCILAVSGDLTSNELKELLNKYLAGWKKSGQKPVPPPMAAMRYQPGVYYAFKDINQAHIRFGHLSMDTKNPDRHAMEIMNFALGSGGFSSRLAKQVRTTAGLAYGVGSYDYQRPLMGTFFGYCLTRADALGQAAQMMIDIINDVRQNGITADEMELARDAIINSYVFNYDTPARIVAAKANLEYFGFPLDQMKRDIEDYKAVTLEDCNRVARQYLDMSKDAIIFVGNKDLFDKPVETFGPVTEIPLETK